MTDRPDSTNPAEHRSLARAVLGGTGLLIAAGVAVKLLGLASSPILTRLVGPAPYGVVALAGTISSLATTVAMLGVDLSYARFFFDDPGEPGKAVERFCWRFTLGMAAVLSLATGFVWWRVGARSATADLAIVVAAGTIMAVATSMATTRQRILGAYPRIASASIAGGVVGVATSLILAWKWRPDAWAMLLGVLTGSFLTVSLLGVPPVHELLRSSGLDRGRRAELLRMGFSGALTAPMYWVMNSADRWFLGAWKGTGPLGVYAFAAGIGLTGIMVNSALTLTWFPEISREYGAASDTATAGIGRLWSRLSVLLMVTWLAVSAAGGDLIRLLADPRFHEGAPLVPWLAGGVFFYGMATLANTGFFLKKNLLPTAVWWTAGAAVNVAANAVLVGPLGTMGAALASCVGFAVIAAGMTWSAQSRLFLPIPWGRIALSAAIVLAAGIGMSNPWDASPLRSILLKFPVGVAAAALLGGIAAPDWMRRLASGAFIRRAGG
jgi:O-antigen/teichoic acid export membrane protein